MRSIMSALWNNCSQNSGEMIVLNCTIISCFSSYYLKLYFSVFFAWVGHLKNQNFKSIKGICYKLSIDDVTNLTK
jgi:hypothetical protein